MLPTVSHNEEEVRTAQLSESPLWLNWTHRSALVNRDNLHGEELAIVVECAGVPGRWYWSVRTPSRFGTAPTRAAAQAAAWAVLYPEGGASPDSAATAALEADTRAESFAAELVGELRSRSLEALVDGLEALTVPYRSVNARLADPNDLDDAELTALAFANALEDAGWSDDEVEFAQQMGLVFKGEAH